ncbi:MAG TPA: PKD domain-containing protein [Bacteroides sp.]|nr:PKD domain-containing protein [Bacteroides sp.]
MKRLIIPFTGTVLMLCFNSCTREPNAEFSFSTPTEVGEIIQFTNLSTNSDTYNWDFGDGLTSAEESPSHQYEKPDTYTVSLKADGKGGSATTTQTLTVTGITYSFTNNSDYPFYNFYSCHWTGSDFVDVVEHGTLSPGEETEVVITDKPHVDFLLSFTEGGDVFVSTNSYNLTINQHNNLIITNNTQISGGSKKSAEGADRGLEIKRAPF